MRSIKRIGLVLIFALCAALAFAAQDPSVLLEKAIYTEETLGNLNDAITIYQQVVANADAARATAAQALFRLGMCYQKSGRTSDAQAAFAKLSKLYPEQRELIAQIPGVASEALHLRPAPWSDGEILQFSAGVNINTAKGPTEAGTYTYKTEASLENGKQTWILETLMEQGSMGIVQYSKAVIDATALSPISSSVKMPLMGARYQLRYMPDFVEQSSTTKNGAVAKSQVPTNRRVYDYSQLEMLLRCLPLREGFQATITTVPPGAALVYDVKISVASRENVKVPAGIFDCYKVITNHIGQERVYWISTDANAFIVKMNQTELLTMELRTIKKNGKLQTLSFEDREQGITISASPKWYVSPSYLPQGIHLMEPESEADGMLTVYDTPQDEKGEPTASLDIAMDRYIALMQKQRTHYTIRPDSKALITLSGLPAIRFIADSSHILTGQGTTEYTYIFTKSGKWYRLVFQAGAEKFDFLRSDFETIADSLQLR